MSQPFVAVAMLASILVAASGTARAQESVRPDGSRIVNGVATHGFPTTGALLVGLAPGSAILQCSGTLIGCNTFLTAAHCVIDDPDPAHYFVFLQHSGLFSVTSVVPHDDFRVQKFPVADVAVLTLGAQVTGIDPTAINGVDPTPLIPEPAVIAGFGQTLAGAGDYGIKRQGMVETRSCNSELIGGDPPPGDTELVCWTYMNPVGPPGTDSNTCNGDSGGPLFITVGGEQVVAGTTSGGTSLTCDTDDHSYDANVFTYSPFILDRLGSDSTSSCGPIPTVGSGSVSVVGNDGTLTAGNVSDSYSVVLSSHTNVLRFVLNGEDNGVLDADLYVRRGAPPTTSVFDCKADAPGNFGACEFELPALGTWHALVQRAEGTGDYQLTTTIFGGATPVCGNDVAETGEDCDGTDDSRCDGLCSVIACTCPPPSCGNDVTEEGEECDGTDEGECLAACAPDCTCAPTCGDGACDPGETVCACSQDCGCGAAGACPYGGVPGVPPPDKCYCDPLCPFYGDCCADACTECSDACTPGCGNGVLECGEQCDDGNAANGDCCDSSCSVEPSGTSCDDGTLCTSDDQCDSAGLCVGAAALTSGCFEARKASLKLDDALDSDHHDRLEWNWLRGEAVSMMDLGDPSTTTSYELCVFDEVGSQPRLGVRLQTAPSAAWEQKPGLGWNYSDSAALRDGLRKIRLQTGLDGSPKVKLKARGFRLDLPGPVSPGYFAQDPSVVVQLHSSAGKCWTTEFPSATKSYPEKFTAKWRAPRP
jgi:cysteine-rich repeat protein